MISIDLDSRVAIVTGASSGLGAEIARGLARAGAAVVLGCRSNLEAADGVADQIRAAGGRAMAFAADIADPGAVERMVAAARQRFGPVTILVNNAGREERLAGPFELDWTDYQRMVDLNLKGAYYLAKAVHPDMRAAGWGRIISIGSVALSRPFDGSSAYNAGKGAMLGLTRSLAHELGPDGITVNTIQPGWIPVERHGDVDPAVFAAIAAEAPLRRMGRPDDVAGVAVWLCSELASFVTANAITVNGGLGGQA